MRSLAVLALLTTLGATGCLGFLPSSPKPQYFVLSPTAPESAPEPRPDLALGVGPVEIPGYLDRPQIGVRTGPNEISFSDTARWSEPLQRNVSAVLMQNLAARLGTDRVSAFPFGEGLPRDYDVAVSLLRFECSTAGPGAVEALWRIRGGEDGALLAWRQSQLAPSCGAGTPADQTAALSEALDRLSREMASAIRQLEAVR